MGIFIIVLLLPAVLLASIGIRTARSKKIIISRNYEVTGTPVSIFSKTYIIVSLIILGNIYYAEAFLRNAVLIYTTLGIILALVTILTLSFGKKRLTQ